MSQLPGLSTVQRRAVLEMLELARKLRASADHSRTANRLFNWIGLARARARRTLRSNWRATRGAFVPIQDGTLFFVPPELDLHGYTILTRGVLQSDLSAAIARFARPGTVVIDVGANIGEISVPLARSVGPGGLCLSVEPIPFLADALRRTATANGLDGLRVFNCAASDTPGTVQLDLRFDAASLSDTGGTKIVRTPVPGTQTTAVRAERLDDLASEALIGARAISLMKIDVEGHERYVLAGAQRILRTHRPTLILEIGNEQRADREAVFEQLSELEYEPVAAIFRRGWLPLSWPAIVELTDPLESNATFDILVRPRQH